MNSDQALPDTGMAGNQDPLDSPDDIETEKQYEEEPEALPDDAGVNGKD